MNYAQAEKTVVMFAAGTVSSGATTSAVVNRVNFDYAKFVVELVAATATNSSAKFLALGLSEADTSAISSATSIVAFTGTTNSVTSATAGFVIPAQNDTTNPLIVEFDVDLKARKEFLFLIVEGASSHSTIHALCTLSRAKVAPSVDSQRGTNLTSVIG